MRSSGCSIEVLFVRFRMGMGGVFAASSLRIATLRFIKIKRMGLTKGRLRSGMKPILQVTQRRFTGGHAKEVATGGTGTGGHAEEGLL